MSGTFGPSINSSAFPMAKSENPIEAPWPWWWCHPLVPPVPQWRPDLPDRDLSPGQLANGNGWKTYGFSYGKPLENQWKQMGKPMEFGENQWKPDEFIHTDINTDGQMAVLNALLLGLRCYLHNQRLQQQPSEVFLWFSSSASTIEASTLEKARRTKNLCASFGPRTRKYCV